MSRRFGRNQRRKLREQVAIAESRTAEAISLARTESAAAYALRRDLDGLRDDIRYAREILGNYHVALPAEIVKVGHIDERCTRLMCGAVGKIGAYRPLEECANLRDMTFTLADCATLVAKYGEHGHDLSVHAYVNSENGAWGYAMAPRYSLLPNQIRPYVLRATQHLTHKMACDLEQFYKTGNTQ